MGLAPVYFLLHVALIQLRPQSHGVRLLGWAGLFYGGLCTALFWLMLGPPAGRELLVLLALTGFLALGWAQVFSLACRGFSLRILVEVFLHASVERTKLSGLYAGGRGLAWLQERRLQGLESLGLLHREGTRLQLPGRTSKILGHLGNWSKSILNLGSCG